MDNGAIQTLETAAQVLLAPPNLVTSEQRHQAESVFLQFRVTKNPYQLCREILEKSSSDYVLFEAANLLKAALIREWNLLSPSDICSLKEYLLHYLLRRETPSFLREKLLQTIAIIIKRGSIEDGGRERKELLDELEKIILNSSIGQQRLACSLIFAIMQEYAITVKSADVGLIWDVHFRLKKSFEAMDLKRIFRFTVGILQQLARSGHQLEGDSAALTEQLLTIVEMILCWGQVSPVYNKLLIGVFEAIYESDTAPVLRLTNNWKDTILQPELVSLFIEIHMYVRSKPQLANPSITCLVQLASLSGVVVSNAEVKKQYLENYVNSFLSMLPNIQPFAREVLGIADIYRRLTQFFPPAMIAELPPAFLQNLTTMTCHSIRASVVEEGVNDDTVWRECLNKFLHTWCSLVHEPDNFPAETLEGPCMEVFNTYLQCRLAPPDGTRGTESSDGCSEEVDADVEEDERSLHSNVLLTIGAIARKAPAHAGRVLFALLHDRRKRLEAQLQLMHMGKMDVSGGRELLSLFEDLHWVLMITGHFIAVDCVEAETLMIPPEIVRFSLAQTTDVDASLRFLVGESACTGNVDPIIKLVAEVLRVSAWETAALEAGLASAFSPELSATVSWLLKIWANSYLMPQGSAYSEMSQVFEAAWGVHSSGVSWSCRQLVARVHSTLRHLHAQPAAATQALSILVVLAQAAARSRVNPLASCEQFLALVAWEAAGSGLPGDQRRELHRAFAIAATYAEGEARTRLVASTAALQEKLMNLINMDSDTEPVRSMLADTLDCFVGVTNGVLEVGPMDEQFMMLIGALDKIPGIVYRYHNYPGVVLPALNLLAKSAKRILNSVQAENVSKFLEICNTTFEVYARWNSGKISSIPQDAEEEAYDDICALMEVTCSVARCGEDAAAARATAAGLRLTLPLVTAPLLQLPRLAQATYRTLRDLESTDQLMGLPMEDFAMVIGALRVGLTAVACDVTTLCCNTIVGLANKARCLGGDNPNSLALLPLAELLLILIIKRELPPDSVPTGGAALYALICIKPDPVIASLARNMIEAFAANDEANIRKLEESFTILTNGVLFDGRRPHRIRFQDNFDKFLPNVQGYLIVK